jgi:hypothetical protein
MSGLGGLKGWQWLFIVEGTVTALVAIAGFWLLPNTPLTTRWLTEEERELAHARMQRDRVGDSIEGEVSAWVGLKQAAADKRTYVSAGPLTYQPGLHQRHCSDIIAVTAGFSALCKTSTSAPARSTASSRRKLAAKLPVAFMFHFAEYRHL